MIYNKKRFGELIDEAVGQIAIKRGGGTKFAATEGELAGILDCSVSTIQKYRQGASMPSDPTESGERLVRHCVKQWSLDRQWAESLLTNVHHPNRQQILIELFPQTAHHARVVISYQGNFATDQALATFLFNCLKSQGHDVFPDSGTHTNDTWFTEIDQQIRASDLVVVLLSESAASSELKQDMIRHAHDYRQLQQRPNILPVFVDYAGPLPHPINTYLDERAYIIWRSPDDNDSVAQEILKAVEGNMPDRQPIQFQALDTISEDGDPIASEKLLVQPRPQFNLRFLESLEVPGGAVKLRDQFYIERDADRYLTQEVLRPGTTVTIRAPRQSGKSSLLVRGLHHARQHGRNVINLDIQSVSSDYLVSLDHFLRSLAESIVVKLRLDLSEVDKLWRGSLGPHVKLTYLFEDYILPKSDAPVILALDESDRLLKTDFYEDFFSLIRSWHNQRAYDELWDRLSVILVISTEPYLLIPDISKSPFNVGLKLNLRDFDREQVAILNERHGSPIDGEEVDSLLALLNGHPYLTRKAFYTLVTEQMSLPELIKIADDEMGPFGDHLRHHFWLLQDDESLKDALKQVIKRHRCDDEAAFFRLLRAGLVNGTSDSARSRCDLYRIYLGGKL